MPVWGQIALPVVISILSAWATARFYHYKMEAELEKEFKSSFIERKWDTYTEFAQLVKLLIQSTTSEELQPKLPEIIQQLRAFISKLWIVGSEEVIEAVREWQSSARELEELEEGEQNFGSVLIPFANILIAMREDLSNEERTVTEKQLLSTFIHDIEDHLDELED